MDICKGVNTRERVTKARNEKAILDFVLVCAEMREFAMFIDENRIHVLTKYASKKGRKKHKTSDHNILVNKFSIQVEAKPRSVRAEFYQLKNCENQKMFFQETRSTAKLSLSFDKNRSFSHNEKLHSYKL